MLGTIVNTACIIVGTIVGTVLHRGIKEKYKTKCNSIATIYACFSPKWHNFWLNGYITKSTFLEESLIKHFSSSFFQKYHSEHMLIMNYFYIFVQTFFMTRTKKNRYVQMAPHFSGFNPLGLVNKNKNVTIISFEWLCYLHQYPL